MGIIFILVTDENKQPQEKVETETLFEPLWKAEQVAEYLNTDEPTVYELARDGKLPSVPLSKKRVRFVPATIRQWVLNGGKVETKLRLAK
jgi:excisionase family DNA binding protein